MERVSRPLYVMIIIMSCFAWTALAEKRTTVESHRLVRAVMCEGIKDYEPVYPAVVFSIDRGSVSCFTEFDRISGKAYIYHKWYRRDSLITVKRLTINPPRWSSFTSVQLRDADKDPWRVEVTDEKDNLIHTLRFSIVE